MTIEELRNKHKGLIASAKAIQDRAKAEDGRSLTDEEASEIDGILDQAEEVDSEIKRAEAEDRRNRRLQAQAGAIERMPEPSVHPMTAVAPPTMKVRERVEDDPKKGFKTPREFLCAVMEQRDDAVIADPRLKILATNKRGEIMAAAGSDENQILSDPHGGFLVPAGFSPNVLSLRPEDDFIKPFVRTIPMSSPKVQIPARTDKNHTSSVSGGLTVSRRAETAAATASRMEVEQVELNANGLFGFAFATEELLADSPQSFAAILAEGFGDEFANQMIAERLSGTGVGEFEGIFNSPALVTVAKESAQAAATINITNIIKMRARCWGYGNAIWIANNDTLPQLLAINTASGHIAWFQSAREDHPALLFGRPIFFTEHAETLGTVGDIFCCNWREYLEGTLQQMQSAESIHVRFQNHERSFKFWTRNDGRCWWRAALTPKKSSSTLSPFVALATRA